MSRTRTLTAGLAAAALLLAATPVSAATETYAAEASSAGLSLRVLGNDVLEVGGTFAAAVPGEATARATPLALAGTPIGGREARSDGPLVADPTDADDRCLLDVPAPLDAIVGAGTACGEATAEGAAPAAVATAGAAELELLRLDGAALAPLHELLASLPLDAVLGPVEDQLLGTLAGAFGDVRARCLSALDPLNLGGLLDGVLGPITDAAPEEVAALLTAVTDLLSVPLPLACDVLGDLADLLVGGDLLGSIARGDLLAALTGAEGVVSVRLLETESGVAREGEEVLAVAGPAEGGAIAITVDVPLLDDVLGDLLTGVLTPVLTQLTALLSPVADAVGPLPVVGDLVAGLLDGDLAAVTDGPLLAVAIAPGGASVTADLGAEETTGVATPAVVELGGSLLSLPILAGVDDALEATLGALDETVLAELRATPLGELLAVELLPESVVEAEVGSLPGVRATSGTASVQLLGVLTGAVGGPLVDLQVASSQAAVGLGEAGTPTTPSGPDPTPVTAPPSTPQAPPTRTNLPATGGGAALLGLAAMGAAVALRRRG